MTGKAGANLQAFVALIDAMRERDARPARCARSSSTCCRRQRPDRAYKTEKEGADRLENLEELVNAAEAFVTQEGFGKDAVALPVDEPSAAARSRVDADGVDESDADAADAETGEIMSPLAAFLTHAALEAGDNQAQAGQDAIQLMTVHSAKGLEFDCVFITGLEEGLFPHENSLARRRRPRGGAAPDVRGDHARAQAPVPELQRRPACCTARRATT